MAELQKIQRMKFGIIDQVYMNTIVDAVNDYQKQKPKIDEALAFVSNAKKFTSQPFLAQIISNTPVGNVEFVRYGGATETIPVIWAYKWQAVLVEEQSSTFPTFDIKGEDDPTQQITTDIIADSWADVGSWTYTGYAFNLSELANVQTYSSGGIVNGVEITSEAYPSTFKPVGTPSNTFMLLTKRSRPDGLPFFVFDRQGTHDGESCP